MSFHSYIMGEWINPHDPEDYSRRYILIDNDFGQVIGISDESTIGGKGMVIAIIREYSSRHLNVEGNLCIFLLQQCERSGWSIKQMLTYLDTMAKRDEPFANFWNTVDQEKLLSYAIFS